MTVPKSIEIKVVESLQTIFQVTGFTMKTVEMHLVCKHFYYSCFSTFGTAIPTYSSNFQYLLYVLPLLFIYFHCLNTGAPSVTAGGCGHS